MFESTIAEIAKMVHAKGGLVYGDGANMNALLGVARPGDMGFDVMQYNLHKTFTTPHGGGGPGSGPVAVKRELEPFLPLPVVVREGASYRLVTDPAERARSRRQAARVLRQLRHVRAGLHATSASGAPRALAPAADLAVLNANYLRARLREAYHLPYETPSLHEVVLRRHGTSRPTGVSTLDVAKRLIDYGFHPPTIYFPLVVHGALMIEPTETESKETLDAFADAMIAMAEEARRDPEALKAAPTRPVRARLDETRAARKPVLRWKPGGPS